jgi:hypothetical protein
VLLRRVPSSSSPSKGLYNPKAFITHAASLDQGCPHCPRFPTAASRRSLGRVSVPVWLIVLSDQLPIAGLVGRYPTNYLIGRGPLPSRRSFGHPRGWHHPVLAAVSRGCPRARGRFPRVTHPSATHPEGCVRLACVRRAASVRSEPGSNSQLEPPSRAGTGPGPRHHCQGRPQGRRSPHPQKGRSKATSADPFARPAADVPQRTPAPRTGADSAPPPAKMPEPATHKAAAHASLPTFSTCPKTNPAFGGKPPAQTRVRGTSGGGSITQPSPNDRAGNAYVGRVSTGSSPFMISPDR